MYIDPAAGSLILQLLAAGLIAGGASIRRVRERVHSFFKSVFFRGRRTR